MNHDNVDDYARFNYLLRSYLLQSQIQMEDDYKNEIDFKDKMTILNSVSVKDFPHRCVGVIYAKLGMQQFVGTGFLLASNLVLTVAHNLYSRQHQCFLSNLVFYPGVSGDHNQKNGLKVIDWRLPKQYISNKGIDPIKYDYALLKLEGNVEGAEFLELGGNYKERKEDVGVIGYRATHCTDDTAMQSCLWKANAHSVQPNGEVLRHQLSTLGGNSGSPILVKRGKKGERHAVIAIHKGAPGEKAAFNEARIITNDLILNVLAWEKEMADSRIRFSLMLDSDQETVQIEAAKWLQDKKLKLAVIASQLQQPKPTQLEKQLQIKKEYLNEVVDYLKNIPEGEKKQITSLTLKLTGINDAIQPYFIVYAAYR